MFVRLEGVHKVTKRHADGSTTVYAYAWRGGPRLNEKPGTPAFHAEYTSALATKKKPPQGTLFTLIAEYKASSKFTGRAEVTRSTYLRYLKLIEDEFGSVPIAALSDMRMRGDFMDWRDKMAATPRAADLAWTILARVLSVAKDRGRLSVNICERGGRLYAADRTDALWTEDMIATVRETFPAHLRWVFMFALYTGQRRGDLLVLPWSGIEGGRVKLRQKKTGARVSIPIASTLRDEIVGIPKRSPTLLTSSDKQPWTDDGFSASWRKACAKAGISGVTFHDVRGTAVTKLAEAGCPVSEIATITGHSLVDAAAILDAHYLSRSDTLADSAIRRLERKERRTEAAKSGVKRSAAATAATDPSD